MPDFSIIIVTWNALHHLKRYLPSVAENSGTHSEIIIADNASTDGTSEWVTNHFPDFRVISLDKNYGYCGGNNRAAEHAKGKYLVFLNNDVEVTPHWLTPLAEAFINDPLIAALQPKIRSHADPGLFEYAGAAGGFLDRLGYPYCRGRIFDTLEKDHGQYDEPSKISWASGAALAIRKELFQKSGGFDISFEFHMEEIDLCWRLWNQGYQVQYCPDSVVYHLGGGSLPAESPRKTYYNFRNNLKMIAKNSQSKYVLPRVALRLVLDQVASARALLRMHFRESGAICRAQLHFLRSLPDLVKKRKALQKERILPTDYPVLQPYILLWHYFFRGKKTFRDLHRVLHKSGN